MSPTVFLGAMLVIIGAAIGALLWKVTRDVRILYRRGLPVTGRVVSMRPTTSSNPGWSTVEYLDPMGVKHTNSWGFEIDTDSVELLIDPDKPSRVTFRASDPHSAGNRVIAIATCVAGVIAGVLLIAGVLG